MERLTNREKQVAELLIDGKSNKEIAAQLYISVHTVKANLENIYDKLGIHNRVVLAVYIVKQLFAKKS